MSKNEELLVAFDLDGTLTTHHSSWQFILERANKWEPEGRDNLENFLSGKLKGSSIADQYLEFCRLDTELLKGFDYSKFISLLNEIVFRDHIKELIRFLKKNYNSRLFIISAGFQELAKRALQKFGFDEYFANELGYNNGVLDGSMTVNVSWFGKKEILADLKKKFNLNTSNVISFGDSSGDLKLFEESGLNFACFNASGMVIDKADYHITNFLDVPELIRNYVEK